MAAKRILAALALLLSVAPSQAGTMRCSFTEPFFSIIFESETGKVTVISPDVTDPDTGKTVPEVWPNMPGWSGPTRRATP